MKRALILDLDNTIYPVKSIADKLFAPLFKLMDQYRQEFSGGDFNAAIEDIMKKPFQKVADTYKFNRELTEKGMDLLRNATYDEAMKPFEDYNLIKDLAITKYLVTTGFLKLQQSKIKSLRIEKHFEDIFIVDPDTTSMTKRDVFLNIMMQNNLQKDDLLVIGDDPESEIEAANDLGIETFLYDPDDNHKDDIATYKSKDFELIKDIISRS
ncbi:putative hydrolase of the HAD superfamily [Arcticibacter tournemirensis]|uniref:HAD family hydrolase n=1 Tax=Arcticibacter tournemirensis TaxID=699437 RepID=A0A5M9HAC8_9SPHI|nr:HAD hydrolase-like protein [Arcticibacter tournemirensis]KAA8483329.1 HAD family hydrolase [Arcticibacter tournemirensis]TQM50983.1 putative hydrolase of the HAD superfamily [Arcticibacter tournemirensis]